VDSCNLPMPEYTMPTGAWNRPGAG